jgi:hypothetical protein
MGKIDELGETYGRGVVIAEAGRSKNRYVLWQLRCSCGNLYSAKGSDLRRGDTRSCGCLLKEQSTTHGHSRTPEYAAWCSANDRCHNPRTPSFKDYGGRGITVCPEWRAKEYGGDGHGFERFLAHLLATIGLRPAPEYSIDRIKNEGGYEPGNIRWATQSQQIANRRTPRRKQGRPPGFFDPPSR